MASLIEGYDDNSEPYEIRKNETEQKTTGKNENVTKMQDLPNLQVAPYVNATDLQLQRSLEETVITSKGGNTTFTSFIGADTRVLFTNPKMEILEAPVQGPLQAHEINNKSYIMRKYQNHLTGQVDELFTNPCHFDIQYNNYHSRGYAVDPSDNSSRVIGGEKIIKRQELQKIKKNSKNNINLSDNERESIDETQPIKKSKPDEPINNNSVTTEFHGRALKDYQGRSWLEAPKDFKCRDETKPCYLPKREIHSYVGHTMGVQAIRYLPSTAHMLLSAGLDGHVKIWDCYNQRKCMRTYSNHSRGVRDINFTTDGRRFYSCSYDKYINLWDTETGQVIGRFTNNKTPYCVTVHPDPSEQNIFIIGSSDKKAVQFDANTGNIVQEYNEHLGAVNSVTFVDNERKIVTSSDDKKLFLWDYGIPVVVKHIAEPFMHSMPSACVHPSKKFVVFQSMDNQIVTYETSGRFKFQGRKRFKGHINSGYAIHPGFSPNGQYLMSGDASGRIWFWDWNNLKNFRTLQAHKGVCIDCAWHPHMISRVATCGWDGLIKLWD